MFCCGWDFGERLWGVAHGLSARVHICAEPAAEARRELWVDWKGTWKTILLVQKVWFPESVSLFKEPINKDQNILTHHLLLNLLWSEHWHILVTVKAFAEKSLELLCIDLPTFYNYASKWSSSNRLLVSVYCCFCITEDKHALLHTCLHTSHIRMRVCIELIKVYRVGYKIM